MKPLISVIIPTYQHAASLPKCLDSVFAQIYQPLEVIVVDDGSTDDTQAVLERYAGRIISIKQENAGANPARNRGLREAKGDYVIFCDADVTMSPGMLERMYGALTQHPEASYAYSGFWFGWKHFKGIPFSADGLKRTNFVHTSSLVRRADFPGFDDAIKRLQDWDVWLTMLEHAKVGILVPETLFTVGIDGASRIGSSWLPAFVYRLPWHVLGWKPLRVKKYEAAREIIKSKHHL
ncbi:MAG TPA: glycosyltransferase family 2 protein [bacterium]|nr:glycosyltransferase family 2 protein [bacterium]